jgi:hypothetical protein
VNLNYSGMGFVEKVPQQLGNPFPKQSSKIESADLQDWKAEEGQVLSKRLLPMDEGDSLRITL